MNVIDVDNDIEYFEVIDVDKLAQFNWKGVTVPGSEDVELAIYATRDLLPFPLIPWEMITHIGSMMDGKYRSM